MERKSLPVKHRRPAVQPKKVTLNKNGKVDLIVSFGKCHIENGNKVVVTDVKGNIILTK
jgi:hypothetical protein